MNETLRNILPITAMFFGLLAIIKFYINRIENKIERIENKIDKLNKTIEIE